MAAVGLGRLAEVSTVDCPGAAELVRDLSQREDVETFTSAWATDTIVDGPDRANELAHRPPDRLWAERAHVNIPRQMPRNPDSTVAARPSPWSWFGPDQPGAN
jgi:hypothetical protein